MPCIFSTVKLATVLRNLYPIEELTACLYHLLHFFSCCPVLSKICKMPKCCLILTCSKIGDGLGQPYPIEELTASSLMALYKLFTFLLLLSCSVSNSQHAQMPRNLPAVKLATGSRSPYPIEELTASSPLTLY
jgi:hypothetical protein